MNYYNYFTEIEEHFVRRRGKHLYISPLDWHLIETWRDAGVPLHVALRGIDIAMDHYLSKQHAAGARLNTLAYCHQGVMEEYARYLESRVGEQQPAPIAGTHEAINDAAARSSEEPDKESVLRWLQQRIFEIQELPGKQSLQDGMEGLQRLLLRLQEIVQNLENCAEPDFESLERDLGLADQLLIEELRPHVPEERMLSWEQEVKQELGVYKKRLPKATYQKIRESYLRRKIHSFFQLGELSIFQM